MQKKLVDIVVEAYDTWPRGAAYITQDTDKELRCYSGGPGDLVMKHDRYVDEYGEGVVQEPAGPSASINGNKNGSPRVTKAEYLAAKAAKFGEEGHEVTPELQASIAAQIDRINLRLCALRALRNSYRVHPGKSEAGRALDTHINELVGRIRKKQRLYDSNQAKLDAMKPKDRWFVINQLGRDSIRNFGIGSGDAARAVTNAVQGNTPLRYVRDSGAAGGLVLQTRAGPYFVMKEDCTEVPAPE